MIRRWPPDNTLMYKIPFRQIWCDSIRSWCKEMAWVFIVMKLFRSDIQQMIGEPEMAPQPGGPVWKAK